MLTRAMLESYLQAEEIEYHLDAEDADTIHIVFQTRALSNVSLDVTILNSRTILFLARAPISIPEAARLEVCQFITRVNYGVVLGGFEMDLDDGELNYKIVGTLGRDSEIDEQAFRRLLYLGNSMLDKYTPGILSIVYGGRDARAVYKEITKK